MRVLVLLVLTAAVASASAPAGVGRRAVSDGLLRVAKPHGWFGSIGPGRQSGRPVAWILVGNFPFRGDAAAQEATPAVPPHRVLISLGDFIVTGPSARWRRVRRLRLPQRRTSARVVSWNVRFAGRAVPCSVRFGSKPNARMVSLANGILGSVRRVAG